MSRSIISSYPSQNESWFGLQVFRRCPRELTRTRLLHSPLHRKACTDYTDHKIFDKTYFRWWFEQIWPLISFYIQVMLACSGNATRLRLEEMSLLYRTNTYGLLSSHWLGIIVQVHNNKTFLDYRIFIFDLILSLIFRPNLNYIMHGVSEWEKNFLTSVKVEKKQKEHFTTGIYSIMTMIRNRQWEGKCPILYVHASIGRECHACTAFEVHTTFYKHYTNLRGARQQFSSSLLHQHSSHQNTPLYTFHLLTLPTHHHKLQNHTPNNRI